MELNFKNKNGAYEAQVKVNGDFNVHVERPKTSTLKIYQKSSELGQYASEASWGNYKQPKIVDEDFAMLVYPKIIKIVSGSPVINASVDCKEGVSIVTSKRAVQADDFSKIWYGSWGEMGPMNEGSILNFSDQFIIEVGAAICLYTDQTIVDASGRLRHNPDLGYYYFFNDPGGPCVPVTIDMTNLLIEE